MIQNPKSTELQILLTVEYEPHTYHAQALLAYMKDEGLSEIKINGGGKVEFDLEEKLITFKEKSYAFGKASPDEVVAFCKECWPSFSISTERMVVDPNRKEMAVTGRIFSREKVKYEAENP